MMTPSTVMARLSTAAVCTGEKNSVIVAVANIPMGYLGGLLVVQK